MTKITIIGVDLAKSVFHLHGADATGRTVFRMKLSRAGFHKFITAHPPCHGSLRNVALLGARVPESAA